ncbi:MAG: hypothetical protein JJ992_05755, partial [Planctomycetes bacterium]|nr:hypothetical protein [Planctomycetota bacterium]
SSKSDGDLPEIKLAPRNTKKADAELERIAAELAKAKTIEDVDDRLAETLFGEELSLAAAQVAALVQAQQSANDESGDLHSANAAGLAQAAGTPVVDGLELEIESPQPKGGLDLSASQRLNTVRALSSHDSAAASGQFVTAVDDATNAPVDPRTPDPIEDQINTSMTQTLKALNVKPPVLDRKARIDDDDDDFDDDGDEDKQNKGGFFSRFRRS